MGTAVRAIARGDDDALRTLEAFAGTLEGPFRPVASSITDERGAPMLVLAIHPAAEPVRIERARDGNLVISAFTGSAGPGYHAHVVGLVERLGEALGTTFAIEDESGFAASRDREALEAFTLRWLGETASEVLALHARGMRGLQLSLPEGTLFEHGGLLATPMGPRDRHWLARVASDPNTGRDIFPWWDLGEGATTLRGAALAAMWIDVRWRKPILDSERALLERIVGWLEQGQALDPSIEWPWREQSELFELLGEDSLRATRAHLRASALGPAVPVGYRRGHVRVSLSGGWSMRVPGELAERWEEPGAWVGWDAKRAIWFSSVEVQGARSSEAAMEALPPLEGEGELMGFDRGELLAVARFAEGEEDGARLVQLRAHAVLGAHAAIGTIVLNDDADREWALEMWSNLAHAEEQQLVH